MDTSDVKGKEKINLYLIWPIRMLLGRDCVVRSKSRNSSGYEIMHSPEDSPDTSEDSGESNILDFMVKREIRATNMSGALFL